MITVAGTFYDGRTSRAVPASLQINRDGSVCAQSAEGTARVMLSDLRVSERIGNIPRAIAFPNGGRFETADNDAIDRALAQLGRAPLTRFIHQLESRLRYILVALVVVVVFSWAFVQFGIPAMARYAAFALPAETNRIIGQGTLEILDRAVLQPTALGAGTRARLAARFAEMAAHQPQGFDYRLHFRKGGRIGANALALPSGAIILTDELVRLAEADEEVLAVLAHEFGHVAGRHGMRGVMQDSAVALLIVMITGDVSSTSTLIAALPTLLVEAQYSQGFEREADRYALAYLRTHNIDPLHFNNLMLRLEAKRGGPRGALAYLSSHPPTDERTRLFAGAGDR